MHTPLNQIEVLLADDHPLIRHGLRQSLEAATGFRIVAEASDGEQAIDQLRKFKPQVAVLDIDMPLLDGLRVAAMAQGEGLPVKIIFLTVHQEEGFISKALKLGARGYILKDASPAEIIAGIRTVADGQPFFSPAVTAHLVSRHTDPHQTSSLSTLTPAERAVFKLIAECRTTRQIAALLFVSPRTVETHRANICQKLGLRGNHALTKFALAHQDEL